MLVRLETDQVLKYWEPLKGLIIAAQPVGAIWDRAAEVKLLEAAATGVLQVWTEVSPSGSIDAVLSTMFTEDMASGTMGMLIYSLTVLSKVPGDRWVSGFDALCKYAKSRGCKRVTAFSNNPKIVGIVQKLGGDTSLTLCAVEV